MDKHLKVFGFDVETQGDDINNHNITEVGGVLMRIDDPTKAGPWTKLVEYSSLVWEPGYPPQTEFIVDLTGITDQMLKENGRPPKEAFHPVFTLMQQADFILAHHKAFDKGMLISNSLRAGCLVPDVPWLCTWEEIPYPENQKCKKLSHLGLDHGLKMDHRNIHRSLTDVEIMMEVASCYPFNDILAYAKEPWVPLRIIIPKPWEDGDKGKTEAKKLKYSWEMIGDTKYDKCWVKQVKESQVEKEILKTQYKVVRL